LKCFEKKKKKGDKKERSLEMLKLNRGGSNKIMVLNQVRLKAQL